MITADNVRTLMSLDADYLTRAIQRAGYKGDILYNAKFVGITNAGEFVYSVTYFEDGDERTCKVFVSMDAAGYIVASY